MTRPLHSPFTTTVVGVTFASGYPDNLHTLERRTVRRDLYDEGPVMAKLRHDVDNPVDPNAVAIDVPDLGPIGHIPAALAARLAPELDGGVPWVCEILNVRNDVEHMDRPGVDIKVFKE